MKIVRFRRGWFLSTGLRRPGFTLVELLVATAVMAIVLVLSVQVVTASLNQWGLANDRMTANMQARLALDWISRDIQTVIVSGDDSEWLRIAPISVTGGSGGTVDGSRLMIFCQPGERPKDPASSSSRITGPIAVSYMMGYLDPMVSGGSRKNFALLRTAINPRDTFENMAVANLETDFWAAGVLGFTTVRPEDIVAENVVAFQVIAEFVDETNDATHRSDPAERFSVGPDGVIRSGSQTHPHARLQALEVSLRLLKPKVAARLNGLSGQAWQEAIETSEVFSKRIPIFAP